MRTPIIPFLRALALWALVAALAAAATVIRAFAPAGGVPGSGWDPEVTRTQATQDLLCAAGSSSAPVTSQAPIPQESPQPLERAFALR